MRKFTIANLALASIALSSMALPLWALSFNAPTLGHEWKTIVVYGTGSVQGPIDQINKANQYVGLEQIRPGEIIALKLIPPIYILAALSIVSGGWRLSFWRATLLNLILLVSVPLGIQYWLYVFGHNMNPDATIALDPFTPYVIGSYEVATFKIVTYFHLGYFLLVATFAASHFVNKRWGLRS